MKGCLEARNSTENPSKFSPPYHLTATLNMSCSIKRTYVRKNEHLLEIIPENTAFFGTEDIFRSSENMITEVKKLL